MGSIHNLLGKASVTYPHSILAKNGLIHIMCSAMENELRKTLLETAAAFAKASDCAVSTVARRAKSDPNFFARLSDPANSFTARTFDQVMRWCADNWPTDKQMPLGLMKWIAATEYQKGHAG
ncbi:hypothetical protein HNR26_003789 [Rhizobium rosettiformans]|uniref:Uncharacterized protein n=2 Tax=Rhizobium rosettiformans TaxID=1368430 RepID=A0A4S8PTS3_9HYPH|nr:hypothetical protein [Rhizobium rosettiformans]MBB5277708.1 hypothetical protein [Rhizobium rosettiformans]THV33082.1 hypothetical protein FAA86_17975 [Rhizobium rosettiformans W3]